MPHLPSFFSMRYLFSKKTHNAINLISAISVSVVAIGTLALILILSVFNGLEDLIEVLYNSVQPDVEISPAKGKYIDLDSFPMDKITKNKNIAYYSEVISDMALAKYSQENSKGSERQLIVDLKAVRPDYYKMSGVDSMTVAGRFLVQNSNGYFAVVGNGMATKMGININQIDQPIYIYYPRADASEIDPLNAFNIMPIYPVGVISVQQEIDESRIYVSLEFARKLMNIQNKATSIELALHDKSIDYKVVKDLESALGTSYIIKDRNKQNATIYKITQSEKWSGFLILSFILLIAIFNVVGSITVLILEKKEDIKTLSYLGSTKSLVKKIFLYEGMLISVLGGAIGLILGVIIIIIQQQFGIIPMDGNFAVSAFPVAMKFTDFVAVYSIVLFIGFIAAILPVNRIARSILK